MQVLSHCGPKGHLDIADDLLFPRPILNSTKENMIAMCRICRADHLGALIRPGSQVMTAVWHHMRKEPKL
ncbi:MAG: hypothetical protein C4519_03950 [Desulfobacteraceae bacterium]|nr:MAG: hypothetical protein C4519_03950 [Desulfobacteraceae bacterium]